MANTSALAYVQELASLKLAAPDTNTSMSQFTGTVTCVYDSAVGAVTGLQFGVQTVCAGGMPPGDTTTFAVSPTSYISSLKVGLVPKTSKVGGLLFKVEDAADPKAAPMWYGCGDNALPGANVVPPGMSLATLGAGCLRADPADPASGLQLDGGALYPVVVPPAVTVPTPVAALTTYLYAIGVNSILYEIVVAAQSWKPILTASTGGSPNGLAFDLVRNDLFWVAQDKSLYYWDRTSLAYVRLATGAQLALGGSQSVSDASYWKSSFWFVVVVSPTANVATMMLKAAVLSYSAAGVPSFVGIETYTLSFQLPNGTPVKCVLRKRGSKRREA